MSASKPRDNAVPHATGRQYVGTLVGESTSQEFRLAVAHETIREQDIIAVDAELRRPENASQPEQIRIWAKVQRIERVNPLFPLEQVRAAVLGLRSQASNGSCPLSRPM